LLHASVHAYIRDCETYSDAMTCLDNAFLKPVNEVFTRHRLNIRSLSVVKYSAKTLNPFYTTKKIPHVTVTITKNASLAAIARYISITI